MPADVKENGQKTSLVLLHQPFSLPTKLSISEFQWFLMSYYQQRMKNENVVGSANKSKIIVNTTVASFAS